MRVKNRKCIRRLSFKSLWASRKRNIIAICAIALTTLMFTSLFPRETLSRTAYSVLETYVERINPLVSTLIETETMSTYDNEDSCEKIDYFRHIRNAVAHSKCNYFSDRGKNFVIFSDSNNNGSKVCSIKMECYKVGIILMELQRLIMEYYNQNH